MSQDPSAPQGIHCIGLFCDLFFQVRDVEMVDQKHSLVDSGGKWKPPHLFCHLPSQNYGKGLGWCPQISLTLLNICLIYIFFFPVGILSNLDQYQGRQNSAMFMWVVRQTQPTMLSLKPLPFTDSRFDLTSTSIYLCLCNQRYFNTFTVFFHQVLHTEPCLYFPDLCSLKKMLPSK